MSATGIDINAPQDRTAPALGEIVDLFAGPGGWSEALRQLGRSADEIGIEHEANACKTRAAAGHRTLHADVSTIDEQDYNGLEGLIASPPCQGFSSAGKGAARGLIPELLDSIRNRRWTDRADPDPRVWLIVDLGRWLERLTPEWIALEQVPAVIPIWRTYAEMLRDRGYSVWTGILNAADYGVPQTRRRAILIASRVRHVRPPEPTHAESPTARLFGVLEPWATMSEALGWPEEWATGQETARGAGMTERHGARRIRTSSEPSEVITSKSRSWTVDTKKAPAPTPTAKAGGQWIFTRPATTVQCDPRLAEPGHRDRAGGERQFGTEPIKLSVADALILQSFRPDYPVLGSRTKQFEQIGNAIPPLLALQVLRAVTTAGIVIDAPQDRTAPAA